MKPMYKKPSIGEFRRALKACNGSLTKVAEFFGVQRSLIYVWRDKDEEFASAIKDVRMQVFDESLSTARVVALGIPKYEYDTDEDGNVLYDDNGKPIRRMAGWKVPPNPDMLKMLITLYGKYDKFGFEDDSGKGIPAVKNGVDIKDWIALRNEGRKKKKK